jgi:hypothetical protein
MKQQPKIRCIVEQKALEAELTRCGVSPRKLDKITVGLKDTICVSPEVFQREAATQWSRIIVKAFPPDIPAIRIWFTFDDDKVYIEGVDLLSEFL